MEHAKRGLSLSEVQAELLTLDYEQSATVTLDFVGNWTVLKHRNTSREDFDFGKRVLMESDPSSESLRFENKPDREKVWAYLCD